MGRSSETRIRLLLESGYNEKQRYRTNKKAIDRAPTIRNETKNGMSVSINRSKSEIQKAITAIGLE